jgi:hypothetical protein
MIHGMSLYSSGVMRDERWKRTFGSGPSVTSSSCVSFCTDGSGAIGWARLFGAAAVGTGYYAGSPYYSDTVRSARAAYYGGNPSGALAVAGGTPHYAVKAYYAGGPWYGYSGWDDYASRNALRCTPGTMVKLDDGLMHVCQ